MGSNGTVLYIQMDRYVSIMRLSHCVLLQIPHHHTSWKPIMQCCKNIGFDCFDSYAIERTRVRNNFNVPPTSTYWRALPPCDMKNSDMLHFQSPSRFSQTEYCRLDKQGMLLIRVVLLTFSAGRGSWLHWVGGKCREGSGVHASAAPDVSIGHVPLSSGATTFPDHFIVHLCHWY